MRTRPLGQLDVSIVGLGCNDLGRRLDQAAADRVVGAALEAGITLFDTADVYRGDRGASEQLLGRALGRRRDEAIVATKFGMELDPEHRGARPEYVVRACDASLRALGVDHIDLYQLHVPDDGTPIDETLGALDDLVRAGKVREVGHSNLSAAQVDEAEEAARREGTVRFVSAQDEWSLLERGVEDGNLPAVERHGLAVLPFFPLASGLLTGKYTSGEEVDPTWRLSSLPEERRAVQLADDRVATARRLEELAAARDRSLLELAFSWLLAHDVVASVIAGATRVEQVEANVAAAGWQLEPDVLAEVDAITGRA